MKDVDVSNVRETWTRAEKERVTLCPRSFYIVRDVDDNL
jgi:hypothetical protein